MAIKGYWRLNGNSNDASGNGNNGIDTNITYSQANGRLNQGGGFNGSSSKIVCGVSELPTYQQAITINAWVKCASFSGKPIIARWYSHQSAPKYDWMLDQGTFRVMYGANEIYADFVALPTNTWLMLTGTWNGTNVNSACIIYVNGKQVATGSNYNFGTMAHNTTKVVLGANQFDTTYQNYFNGSIDEVIVDNTVWSPAKIKNYYASFKGFF